MSRTRWSTAVMLALAWLVCLALTLTEPVDRDEHMYLAAADAVGDARLYEDVAFFQPPYLAWVYAGWQRLVPGDQVLLAARLFKALLAAGVVLVSWRLLARLGAGPVPAAVLVLLLVHTEPVRGVVAVARNYDLAQLCILAALLLLPLRPGDEERRWRTVTAGLLAGLAVGCKLTFAAPALVVVAWPLVAPTTLANGRRELCWLAAGATLGLAPLLITAVVTDPVALRFNLWDYHQLNAAWSLCEGVGHGLDLAGKLHDARRLYRHTDLATVVGLAMGAAVLVRLRGRAWSATVWRLALWLLAAGVVMVAVPRPVQTAYYAPLLLAAVMLVSVALARLEGRVRLALVSVIGAACLVNVIHHGGDDLRRLGSLDSPERWPAVRLHEAGRSVARLTARSADGPVATTHPLYALEAGRTLEPCFAAGEFAWRLGDLLPVDRQRRHGVVTPAVFDSLMTVRPAAIIVVEAAAPWDEPLSDWARARGWRPAPVAGGVLGWLPPRPADPR